MWYGFVGGIFDDGKGVNGFYIMYGFLVNMMCIRFGCLVIKSFLDLLFVCIVVRGFCKLCVIFLIYK